jgi:hypothetical protein
MHTNKHNNKVYVGITSQSPSYRWGKNGSKYLKNKKNNQPAQTVFARALKKYKDWDNDWEHIIFAEHLTEFEAKQMERRLIALYKTNCCRYNNPSYGYNMTDGGDGGLGYQHTEKTKIKMSKNHADVSGNKNPNYGMGHGVVQLTPDGEFVKDYVSVVAAAKQTSIAEFCIRSCCEGTQLIAGGFLWVYKKEYCPSGKYNYINPWCKPVVQLTLSGMFVAEYSSLVEAERHTGVKYGGIKKCCDGKYKSAGNFVWRYKHKYNPKENILCKPKIRPLVQLDMDSNFIAEYSQVKLASQMTNTNQTHISSCCTGKRKSAGGFRWMYKDDYDKTTLQPKEREEVNRDID